jgi:hypothetical protein
MSVAGATVAEPAQPLGQLPHAAAEQVGDLGTGLKAPVS